MAIAINQFINQMSQNQFRTTNMFEMYVTSGYADIDKVLQPITMYGQGFEVPSRTTNFTDVSFKGFAVPLATNEAMQNEHEITVQADTAGEIRRAFLAWQAKTWNPDIEGGSVFEGDRRLNSESSIRIHLFGSDFKTVNEIYKMVGVKIASVGPMTMSNTEANVATFTVQFRSAYWFIEKATEGALTEQK